MTDNSAADCPILPKFSTMVHYEPRKLKSRTTGETGAASSCNAWQLPPVIVISEPIQPAILNYSVNNCTVPSVLICSDVRMRANSVALNITVPSLLSGMFI